MATKISVKKGGESALTVVLTYGFSVLSLYAAKKFGVPIPEDLQAQLTIIGTTALTGLVTGVRNYLKHRTKKTA